MMKPGNLVGMALAIAGCGGSAPRSSAPIEPPATEASAVAPSDGQLPDWLAGNWEAGGGTTESWVVVGDLMVGVGIAGQSADPPGFEVMIIHRAGGQLLYTAMPSGERTVDFTAAEHRGNALSPAGSGSRLPARARQIAFVNPEHDHPQRIDYRRDGDRLAVALAGSAGDQSFEMTERPARGAEELMAADRDFAAASRAGGGAVWAARFADQGVSWPRGSERRVGPAAVAAMIDEIEQGGVALRWAPSAAGLGSSGGLGFTTGRYQVVRTGEASEPVVGSGVYVTVWWRVGGSWRILFDTGVADPPVSKILN